MEAAKTNWQLLFPKQLVCAMHKDLTTNSNTKSMEILHIEIDGMRTSKWAAQHNQSSIWRRNLSH